MHLDVSHAIRYGAVDVCTRTNSDDDALIHDSHTASSYES